MTRMHLKPFSFQARTYKVNPSCDQRTKSVMEIPETNWSLSVWLNIKCICMQNSVPRHHSTECSQNAARTMKSTKLVATWEINGILLISIRLTKCQQGVHYMGAKTCNKLPTKIQSLSNNKKHFKKALKKFLLLGSFTPQMNSIIGLQ